jgi:hypothetical protein
MVYIATECGQPWSEVVGMPGYIRRAFVYAYAEQQGHSIDWSTGRINLRKD